ncbi:MAG: S41 family peptidase [Muribaculaceae bacterium]|nr:S41 family peptidase [Muribaculaceae bacterium]
MVKRYFRLLAAAVLTACLVAPTFADQKKDNSGAAITRNLDIFNSLYKELATLYVDTIDAQQSIETAINAMLDDIDPYTEYIPAKEQDDFRVISTGQYGGIGSYIMQRTDSLHRGVYISGPYKDSPAAKAGLRAGDRIVSIDGMDVTGWNQDSVSSHLKGQANTRVTVQVVRPYDADSLKTFTIMRENIKVDPVPFYGVTRGCLGYIYLTTFNEHSAQQVRDAVLALKANPAVKALVLDLRGNGGGLMESAVQIVGMFVPKGTQVLTTRGRDKASEKIYKTTQDPIDTKIPLAVLIDGGSASASEITAGALQDLDRAVVVGSRSFGKGLVQSTRPLPFDGILKVTIAKYYIPSGRLIQEVDYSHRKADGTYERTTVADSLARVFHTANGREVREGGGITPDIKVDFPEMNRLVYNIVRDHWAFDFATKYAAEHPTLPAPADFTVTDEIFNDFKQWLDPERFQYDKVCEQGLATLQKIAKTEGYMNDSTQAVFQQLEGLLKHDLNHDLDTHRSEIARLLAQEIVTRYYYQAGDAENSLRTDECLDRVLQLLAEPNGWNRTLARK